MPAALNEDAFYHMMDKRIAFALAVVSHMGMMERVHEMFHHLPADRKPSEVEERFNHLRNVLEEVASTAEDEYVEAKNKWLALDPADDKPRLDG